jgi:hypothetical protein
MADPAPLPAEISWHPTAAPTQDIQPTSQDNAPDDSGCSTDGVKENLGKDSKLAEILRIFLLHNVGLWFLLTFCALPSLGFKLAKMAFLNMPVELLFLVGAQLDYPKDLLSLARVNFYASSIFLSQLDDFSVRYEHSFALIWASEHGIIILASRLLRYPRILVNTVDACLRTPIFYAVRSQNLKILEMLLSHPQANMH